MLFVFPPHCLRVVLGRLTRYLVLFCLPSAAVLGRRCEGGVFLYFNKSFSSFTSPRSGWVLSKGRRLKYLKTLNDNVVQVASGRLVALLLFVCFRTPLAKGLDG